MQSTQICIFEDYKYENLFPLTYSRPSFNLVCGATSLKDKIVRSYNVKPTFIVRDYLRNLFQFPKLTDAFTLFLNGRILASKDIVEKIPLSGDEEVGINGDNLVFARLSEETIKELNVENFDKGTIGKILTRVNLKEIKIDFVNYPWDLVDNNERFLIEDFPDKPEIKGFLDKGVTVYGDSSRLHVEEGARVEAGVVLNLEQGPISIKKNALVRAHTTIDGPCFIGENSLIDGAKIRGGTTIGTWCKIGGEVENSIFHAFSNKPHEGFIGHAYIGEWVNIGALATNSDLKNNYSRVKVFINNAEINTGSIKVGSFIGDHSKLGIGVLLNTGSVVGFASNLFGGGIQKKYVPSFSWGTSDKLVEYRLDEGIETVKRVMERRKVNFSEEYVLMMKEVFKMTEKERINFH